MTKATFFESEQVQENLNDIFNTYHEIASMTNHLHKMDAEVVGYGFIIELDALKGRERLGEVPVVSLIHY